MKHIIVLTYENNKGDPTQTRVIDYSDHFQRIWLSKHLYWALHNNYEIGLEQTDEPVTYPYHTKDIKNHA